MCENVLELSINSALRSSNDGSHTLVSNKQPTVGFYGDIFGPH